MGFKSILGESTFRVETPGLLRHICVNWNFLAQKTSSNYAESCLLVSYVVEGGFEKSAR